MKMILTQNSFFPVIFGVYINVLPEVVEMLFSKILNQLQSLFFFFLQKWLRFKYHYDYK